LIKDYDYNVQSFVSCLFSFSYLMAFHIPIADGQQLGGLVIIMGSCFHGSRRAQTSSGWATVAASRYL